MINANEVPDSILARIKKLLEGASGRTQAEIETAQALANAMLIKYNVSLAQIQAVDTTKKKKVTQSKMDLNNMQTRHEAGWVGDLANVIAKANLCYVLLVHGKQFKYDQGFMWIIGEDHNIELVAYMVEVAHRKIKELGSILWRQYVGAEKRNTWHRGFYRGAVHGLGQRLRASIEEQLRLPSSQEYGIVLRDKDKAIHEYISLHFNVKPAKNSSLKGTEGYTTGVITGRGMNIGTGIGGADANTQKRLN